jgi:hypothetical protein
MAKHGFAVALWLGLLSCLGANAQTVIDNCPYSPQHKTGLACLIPDVTGTGTSQNLSSFNTTIAQVIGQLPLAVPVSGFVLGFDKKLGMFVEENQNLGSVLTERGDTLGKHKLFVGFTYQRFTFHTIDGTNLDQLPVVFQEAANPTTLTPAKIGFTLNSLSVNVNQYTGFVAVGLTDRIDLSATLPFDRVSMSAASNNGIINVTTATCGTGGCVPSPSPLQAAAAPGSASGVGDFLANIKGTVIKAEKSRLALGLEARFPTGDAYNLLGSGAYGVKPYLVFSRHAGNFTPHVNLGYQWNGFSVLRINPCFFAPSGSPGSCTGGSGLPTLRLPDSIEYSAGADVGIVKKLSLVADLVGQRFFNAPRITAATPDTVAVLATGQDPTGSYSSVSSTNGSYNVDNLGIGLKYNPAGHLILSANALIRLDDGGLRPARFVPLVGISYRFGK